MTGQPERGGPVARQDLVVILARGNSERMGTAKGLVECPGRAGRTMLGVIIDTYGQAGLDCLVVTTSGLAAGYRAVVGAAENCRVLAAPAGGQTAGTVYWGWQDAGPGTTHLWAHPVDLPLVAVPTLHLLAAASAAEPRRVVRPSFEGQPGHPVILPVAVLGRLGDPADPGVWSQVPMAAVLEQGTGQGRLDSPRLVAVPDRGVVLDFDSPADLAQY